MTENRVFALLLALALVGAVGCDQEPTERERAAERAERQAQEQAREEGYGPLDQQVRGAIAKRRVELANDIDAVPGIDDPGLTAAQRLDAVEDGEREESGY
jgi:hypothetical protein